MHIVEIDGTMQGPIWWPIGEPCQKPYSLRLVTGRETGLTVAELVEHVESDLGSDGDFSGQPVLTADSVITITHYKTGAGSTVTRSRSYSIMAWPSLSAIIDPDAWTFGDE